MNKYSATNRFDNEHIQLFNVREIYHAILKVKEARGWYNVEIFQSDIHALLEQNDWYTLNISPTELEFTNYERVSHWQAIMIDLITLYIEKIWKKRRREWEGRNLKLVALKSDSHNVPSQYELRIDSREAELIKDAKKLASQLENGEVQGHGIGALHLSKHAYQPLLYAESDTIRVMPVPLNTGEKEFVELLKDYFGSYEARGREFYLLRNLSRGHGVSIFNDYNFYPDFILWIKVKNTRHIVFIDPKGLSHSDDKTRSKIELHKKIKELEKFLPARNYTIHLHSYIWSITDIKAIASISDLQPEMLHENGIYYLGQSNKIGLSEISKLINNALSVSTVIPT